MPSLAGRRRDESCACYQRGTLIAVVASAASECFRRTVCAADTPMASNGRGSERVDLGDERVRRRRRPVLECALRTPPSPSASRSRRSARSTSNRSPAGSGPPALRRSASAAPSSRAAEGVTRRVRTRGEGTGDALEGVGDRPRAGTDHRHPQAVELVRERGVGITSLVGRVAEAYQHVGPHRRCVPRTGQRPSTVEPRPGLVDAIGTPADRRQPAARQHLHPGERVVGELGEHLAVETLGQLEVAAQRFDGGDVGADCLRLAGESDALAQFDAAPQQGERPVVVTAYLCAVGRLGQRDRQAEVVAELLERCESPRPSPPAPRRSRRRTRRAQRRSAW